MTKEQNEDKNISAPHESPEKTVETKTDSKEVKKGDKSSVNTDKIPKSNEYQEKPGGYFKKGNPGKPKGARHMTSIMKEALDEIRKDSATGEEITMDKLIIKRVMLAAIAGQPWAIKMVMEYVDGKPIQATEIDFKDKTEVSRRDLSDAQRKVLMQLGDEVLKAEGLEGYGS